VRTLRMERSPSARPVANASVIIPIGPRHW
jgi:hypothetical protein